MPDNHVYICEACSEKYPCFLTMLNVTARPSQCPINKGGAKWVEAVPAQSNEKQNLKLAITQCRESIDAIEKEVL